MMRRLLRGTAAAALLVLPHIPFGSTVLYPFMILGTWFHEMGHGLAAMAMGFDFDRLVLLPNGSGYAQYFFPDDASRLTHAVVAAAGPIGPAIIGSGLYLLRPQGR